MDYNFEHDPCQLFSRTREVMVLFIKLVHEEGNDGEDEGIRRSRWEDHIIAHNNSILHPADHSTSNAGFDLLCPTPLVLNIPCSIRYDFNIQCEATMVSFDGRRYPAAFTLFPRSSISKTRFRMANGIGLIDNGYRGNIQAAFDHCPFATGTSQIRINDRLVQLVAPSLCPILCQLVTDVGVTTRGGGGFGSTT